LETGCLSVEFATEGGGEEGRKQTAFPGEFATGTEGGGGGGEEGRKQTAFPGISLPKEEEKRIGNRLPFRGIRHQMRRRRG
jgi:hypothetical protein